MIRLRPYLSILFVSVCSLASAQPKQPLTHEVLTSFLRVGAPVPSPDGKWVVFSVAETGYDPAKDITDLWIVPTDGSAPSRRLTSSKAGEGGPAWSPDSRRLAFSARRDDDETGQIYVLDIAHGGDAQRVTNAATSASAPKWSPDGERILFQAAIWPGATDEESNRKAAQERRAAKSKVRIYETYPVRNFDRWVDESRAHLWIVDLDGSRKARPLFATSALATSRGFAGDSLNAAWAPDGHSVVFVASDNGDNQVRNKVIAGLWQVPAGGGEPSRLAASGWDVGAAKFRPDGKALCFSGSSAKPSIYALNLIACGPWPWTGSPTVLGADLDRSVNSWAFAPDSRTIYFSAEDAARARLSRAGRGWRDGARRRCPAGRLHGTADSGARRVHGDRRELGKRHQPAGGRPHRSLVGRPRDADVVQHGESGRDRLAAAARIHLHGPRRPDDSQLRRAAARISTRRGSTRCSC